MEIAYQEINTCLLEIISVLYGEGIKKHIHIGNDSYSLVALHNGSPVGFISAYMRNLVVPIGEETDAYIDIIEVDEKFCRMGIASEMVARTEEWAKKAGLLQIRAWSSQNKVEAISMWRSLGYGLCPAKIWVEWCSEIVDGYYVVKQLNPINPYPNITKLINQDLQSISDKQIRSFRLIRAKRGIYVYKCLYDGFPAVVKYFENEDDRREILNYRILNQNGIPTIKTLAFGESTLVMEDISLSNSWRLGTLEDLGDIDVARSLAHWYFELHARGADYKDLNSLYFEFDSITNENLEMLNEKLPDATELFQFVLSRFDRLRDLIYKPSLTLTYNDFFWTNFVVRKDKQAAIMFDYNLLGKGYRLSDFRNVSSLAETAYKAFVDEYERLYFLRYGCSRLKEEYVEKQIDEVVAPLFELIAAFEQEIFPQWAEAAKTGALDGALLSKARQLLL